MKSNYSFEIEFTEVIDERRPSKSNRPSKYDVSVSVTDNDQTYEFEGLLVPFNTGRNTDYSFEPSYFVDEESEDFYDRNWEDIDEQIINKFLSTSI